MRFQYKDTVEKILECALGSVRLERSDLKEIIRLAEVGWEIEEEKRKTHIRHCNGVHCPKPELHQWETSKV